MKKKTIALLLALALVFGGAVGGTIAWLTATSDTVTNTFTVGDINIELSETTGTSYKVVPGATVDKDPTVTVKQGSENCYVYVTVKNELVLNDKTVGTVNIDDKNWVKVATNGNTTLYRYNRIVTTSATADQPLSVFTKVTFDGEGITKGDINTLNNKTIEIQAYAHQSENTTQTAADDAAKSWAGMTTTPTT